MNCRTRYMAARINGPRRWDLPDHRRMLTTTARLFRVVSRLDNDITITYEGIEEHNVECVLAMISGRVIDQCGTEYVGVDIVEEDGKLPLIRFGKGNYHLKVCSVKWYPVNAFTPTSL